MGGVFWVVSRLIYLRILYLKCVLGLSNRNLPPTLGGNKGSAPILLFFSYVPFWVWLFLGFPVPWHLTTISEFSLKTSLSTGTYKLPKCKSTVSQSFWKIVFHYHFILEFKNKLSLISPMTQLTTQELNAQIPYVHTFCSFTYYYFLVLFHYKTYEIILIKFYVLRPI